MGIASLFFGILSVVLAAFTSAPCFGWLVFLGAPMVFCGLGTGVLQLLRPGEYRSRADAEEGEDEAGDPEPAEEEVPVLKYALAGIGLSLVSGVWMALMLLIKGWVL